MENQISSRSRTERILAEHERYVALYVTSSPRLVRGAVMYDVDGREYIDFSGASGPSTSGSHIRKSWRPSSTQVAKILAHRLRGRAVRTLRASLPQL